MSKIFQFKCNQCPRHVYTDNPKYNKVGMICDPCFELNKAVKKKSKPAVKRRQKLNTVNRAAR